MKKYFLISLTSIFCCLSWGQNVVFTEQFPLYTPQTTCGTAIISPLSSANGYTTYAYTGNSNACQLDGGEYAVATHSAWSYWTGRTQVNEHTAAAGSGAILINAANSILNQYFYTRKLTDLCPNTQYEFSVWYVSIADPSESPSNIVFEIFEGGTLNTSTGVHSGGNRITFPQGETGETGLFGGTAGSTNSNATSFVWRKKTVTFSTTASTDLSTEYFFKLKNGRVGATGNVFMIDDITLVKYARTLNLYQTGITPPRSSVSVYDDGDIDIFVELSSVDVSLISGGTVYAQLMRSSDQTNWSAVGSLRQLMGSGTLSFSVAAPATTGTVFYYRVKFSSDAQRAQDVNSELEGELCYNDVISKNFVITRLGSQVSIGSLEVCGDDKNIFELIVLPSDNPGDIFPEKYEIVFSEKAVAAGFQDTVRGNFNGGNIIEIPIPNTVYPDNYEFKLTFFNDLTGESPPFIDTLKVYYPKRIMEQKWDDVIALLNKGHCGYAFEGYQWYKGGEIMQGENRSYIYLAPHKLDITACYQVLITRKDGSQVFSCCAELEERQQTNATPTVIQSGQNIKISAIKENSTVSLYTVMGVLLQSGRATSSDYEFRVPIKGIYLLEIRTNSERQVIPIAVGAF